MNDKVLNQIIIDDAAETLHKLDNDDFVNVIAELVHRRTGNLKEVNEILDQVVSKISTSFTIIGR